MSRLRLSSRARPRRPRPGRLVKCHLRGYDGLTEVRLYPAPIAPRIAIQAEAGGPYRVYDLVDSEGERASYEEVTSG